MGSPSDHFISVKYALTSSRVPKKASSRISPLSPEIPAERSSSLMGRVSASTICGQRISRVFLINCSAVWVAKAPGYCATLITGTPLLSAVYLAWSTKPGPAMITDGIPRYSAAMQEPVSLGVQRPQPPLPEMTASTPISLSFAWNSSFALRVMPGAGYGPAMPISSKRMTFAEG